MGRPLRFSLKSVHRLLWTKGEIWLKKPTCAFANRGPKGPYPANIHTWVPRGTNVGHPYRSTWVPHGLTMWVMRGFGRGFDMGPIWAIPSETTWASRGSYVGPMWAGPHVCHTGPRWVLCGPAHMCATRVSDGSYVGRPTCVPHGPQMGPVWA